MMRARPKERRNQGGSAVEDYKLTLRKLALRDDGYIDAVLRRARARSLRPRSARRTRSFASRADRDRCRPSVVHERRRRGLDAGVSVDEIVGTLIAVIPVVGRRESRLGGAQPRARPRLRRRRGARGGLSLRLPAAGHPVRVMWRRSPGVRVRRDDGSNRPDARRPPVAPGRCGCGGGDDSSATEQWASSACSAVNTWTSSIESIGDTLKEDPTKEGVDKAYDDLMSSTQTLVDDLKGARAARDRGGAGSGGRDQRARRRRRSEPRGDADRDRRRVRRQRRSQRDLGRLRESRHHGRRRLVHGRHRSSSSKAARS